MKIKEEYLDLRISFNRQDEIVRFIDKGLYPFMYNKGLQWLFEEEIVCEICKTEICLCPNFKIKRKK